MLTQVPPRLGSKRPADLLAALRVAWRFRKLDERGVGDVTRLMTMSVADLLEERFESDAVRGVLSVSGVIGTWAGPRSPGTAYVMAHHKMGDVGDGRSSASWGFPEGGMGGVTRRAARRRRGVRRDDPHRGRGRPDQGHRRPRGRRRAGRAATSSTATR